MECRYGGQCGKTRWWNFRRRHVDIVVSDLMMPGLDGRQLLKIMNDDYPLIPVVLISAHGDDQMAAECIGLGAVNYVGKTRLADDLISVLSEVVLGEEEIVAMRRVLKHVVQNRCEFEIDSDLNQIRPLVNFVPRTAACHADVFCSKSA